MGKYSPTSSKDSSPRSSKQQLPPIHIHMNTPAAEKSTRTNERVRGDSFGAASPDYRRLKFSAEPMSREASWDRHSGTASFNDNSSVLTADDSVFSEPDRRRSVHRSEIVNQPPRFKSRKLPPRQENVGYPHPAHIYGDVEPRAGRNTYPNDYPQQRESYFDDVHTNRPTPHRRSSIQTPQGNPFDTTRHPPRFGRANTFGSEMHDFMYLQRYIPDRPMQDSLHLDELHDAIEHIREQKRRPLHGHTRRMSEYERGYGGDYIYDRRGY
ncbi:hypothetical protein E8E12_004707 [Didymella heteroderae]|uniref:Uncharacterized protein n=1 Tax=Didymella heteroderae TaxID=1769908 RepID=A0A9P4WHX7_9PLEO|nr:hypothetical protein E8E12_004707 [Didymella heteroderae]